MESKNEKKNKIDESGNEFLENYGYRGDNPFLPEKTKLEMKLRAIDDIIESIDPQEELEKYEKFFSLRQSYIQSWREMKR